MKKFLFLSIMATLLSLFVFANEKNIKILLLKNETDALLEAKGSYTIINPENGSKITSGIGGKRFMVRATNSGMKWGEVYPGIHQIYVVPKNKKCSLLVNGIEYDGAVAIYKTHDKINIINDVDIESYLKSSLTTQFPYPLESEVLSAVAIAARTTAFANVKRNQEAFWHIAKEEANYYGKAVIQPDSHIDQAVTKTKHLILINTKNENSPFAAQWTENSAGKTAPFHLIFRKDWGAPKASIEAPHAALNRNDSKWNHNISKLEFEKLFSIENVKEIKLFSEANTNKTYALRISNGIESKDIDFLSFQNTLGKNKICSNDLSVSIKNNEISFTGYGKGMGVGMCIYSASRMAQNGENAMQILSQFYPETYLINLQAMPAKEVIR